MTVEPHGGDGLDELTARLPNLKGKLTTDFSLAEITWFRVGGPADYFFRPLDENDLVYFLKSIPDDLPLTVLGLGSNTLVRDGGVGGVVIRLGRGFGQINVEDGYRLRVGAAVPDVKAARAAADAGIGGLTFYRGIPGGIGGALRMNGGAHGTETRDVLVSVRAVDRRGDVHELTVEDMGYTYRHCSVPDDWIFTEALYQGAQADVADIKSQMEEVADYRETHQPVKARTGGSTFKNPPGESAWKLIDDAGCRGFSIGGAMVSEKHCNFLINTGDATAEDIERLGEVVRARVLEKSGVKLEWEIKRIGRPLAGRPVGEALALIDDEAGA